MRYLFRPTVLLNVLSVALATLLSSAAALGVYLASSALAHAAPPGYLSEFPDQLPLSPVLPLAAGLGVLTAYLPLLWQRRVRLAQLCLLTIVVLFTGWDHAYLWLVASLLGIAAGALWTRVHPSHRSTTPATLFTLTPSTLAIISRAQSARESRIQLGIVCFSFAIGFLVVYPYSWLCLPLGLVMLIAAIAMVRSSLWAWQVLAVLCALSAALHAVVLVHTKVLNRPLAEFFGAPIFAGADPQRTVVPVLFSSVLIVLMLVCWRHLAPARSRELEQEQNSRAWAHRLLHRGGTSMGWMALWPGNSYWFSPENPSGIAYQLHDDVALCVAGPFGQLRHSARVYAEFTAECTERGLIPAFYGIPEAHRSMVNSLGFNTIAIAKESTVNITEISFAGKKWQNVRTALNKAKKLGVQAHMSRYQDLSAEHKLAIAELSAQWSAERALPQMGFTLGGIEQLDDPEVLCVLAVDATGHLHGLLSWLPQFRDERMYSWTLDVMRRGHGSFPGVMEFLLASSMQYLRTENPHAPGVHQLSLSGSPLATQPHTGEHSGALNSLLTKMAALLEPLYHFKSLARFKRHFYGKEQTLYLAYREGLELGSISRAVLSAYLPNVSLPHIRKVLAQLRSAMPEKSDPSTPD